MTLQSCRNWTLSKGPSTKERVAHQNGQTDYYVQITSFRYLMWDWQPGRLVRLKTINVDGVPLRLDVYPNGNIEYNAGYVSLIITNLATYDIRLEMDLSLHREHKIDVGFDLQAGQEFGFNRFLDIDEVDKGEKDEPLQINCKFKKVWKEGVSYNNNDGGVWKEAETYNNNDALTVKLSEMTGMDDGHG